VLGLPDDANDRAITAAAYDAGVIVRPLAAYYSVRQDRTGLLTGYACVPHEDIAPAFATLARVIEEHAFAKPQKQRRAG